MLRKENESLTEWTIRCCLAKRRHETDMEWKEIRDMLGMHLTPDQLRKMAVGMQLVDEYYHSPAGVATRILAISDSHVPFNLDTDIFAPYAGAVDILVLNGDIEDCFSCSSFPKRYRVGLDEEMALTRKYIIDVVTLIKPKKVFINMGNHEYRLGRYLTDKLNDEIMTIMPDSPMELIVNDGFHVKDRYNKTSTFYEPLVEVFKEEGIEIEYTGDWFCKVGKTLFTHPLTYSSGMLKTTEKAVNFFLRKDRDFNAIVMAHTHRLGSYKQGDILMYEQGCCCDLAKLDYNDGKLTIPGQNGFIYVCQDEDGNIIESKTKLISLGGSGSEVPLC